MTRPRFSVVLPLAALAACVAPAPEPTPAPSPAAPRPEPTQAPPQVPTPVYDDWMDAPQTAGDWRYTALPGGDSAARFGTASGPARFSVVCDRARRSVLLIRSGSAPVSVAMRVRTESADRELLARPRPGAEPTLEASLPAQDSFLDAMAFSKGRFAVQVQGLEPLFLPAWPEISRVIDDCR